MNAFYVLDSRLCLFSCLLNEVISLIERTQSIIATVGELSSFQHRRMTCVTSPRLL